MASRVLLLLAGLVASTHAGLVPPVTKGGDSEEIGSPLRVAQCRARCLQRFSGGSDRESSCLQGPDCFMCWENCALLQANFAVWGAMCTEKRICFPGCQEACRFHRETAGRSQQAEPVILTRGEEVISLAGGVARWRPSPAPRQQHVVYVLMARPPGASSWRQLSQSVECETRLETLAPGTTVRVLAVDPEGLVTIYSPAPAIPEKQIAKQPPLTPTLPAKPEVSPESPWQLREVSLLHQRVLVIAEVAWGARSRRGVYLVTWEVDGGGLRGNLFTDSTSVTLSLWPDTVYHIQVELVSRGAGHKRGEVERSEPLLIDTHKAPPVQGDAPAAAPEPWEGPRRHQQLSQEMLAGTGAAMLLFLIVATVMAWRCHRARSLGRNKRRLLLADDSQSAGNSQPIVSVLTPKDCPPAAPAEPWLPPSIDITASSSAYELQV